MYLWTCVASQSAPRTLAVFTSCLWTRMSSPSFIAWVLPNGYHLQQGHVDGIATDPLSTGNLAGVLVDAHGSVVISACAGFLAIALVGANDFIIIMCARFSSVIRDTGVASQLRTLVCTHVIHPLCHYPAQTKQYFVFYDNLTEFLRVTSARSNI